MQGRTFGLVSLLSSCFHALSLASLLQEPLMSRNVAFGEEWEVLGPFKLGTRGI